MPQDSIDYARAEAMLVECRALLDFNQADAALNTVDRVLLSGHCPPGTYLLKSICFDRKNWPTQSMQAARAEMIINPSYPGAAEQFRLASQKAMVPGSSMPAERPWSTSLVPQQVAHFEHCSHRNMYRGVPMIKNVFDLAIYPMLLWDAQPATIIEIGSCYGGSAMWMADMTMAWGLNTHIYSVDIMKVRTAAHDRVDFIVGDGRNLATVFSNDFLANLPRPWLVIEDADHTYATTSAVMKFFHPRMQPGEYLIVEDVLTSPAETGRALKEFLRQHPMEYRVDRQYCDFFGVNATWCVNGFLRRI